MNYVRIPNPSDRSRRIISVMVRCHGISWGYGSVPSTAYDIMSPYGEKSPGSIWGKYLRVIQRCVYKTNVHKTILFFQKTKGKRYGPGSLKNTD